MSIRVLSPFFPHAKSRSALQQRGPTYTDKTLSVGLRNATKSMSALFIETFQEPTVLKESKRRRRKKLVKRPSINNMSIPASKPRDCNDDVAVRRSKMNFSRERNDKVPPSRLPGISMGLGPPQSRPLTSPPPRQLPENVVTLPPAHERRKKVSLLVAIKPENERTERDRFMRANLNYNPLFIYRYPADSEALERFGQASSRYLEHAILIMNRALERYGSYENFEEVTGGKLLTRAQIYMLVKKYLRKEGLEDEIDVNLSEDLLSRASMSRVKGRPTLNVRVVNLREEWCEGLLRHEVGTHYLRSCNNRYQPWYNCKVRKDMGLRHLNPTEEGLASLHSVLYREDPCLWRAALLYYTAHKASLLSFKELFKDLARFVHSPTVRWDYCLRAKRGQTDTSKPGGFCKDQVYLEGALQILKRRHTIDFDSLVRLGKIAHQDIHMLEPLADFSSTRIPSFMENLDLYRKHINYIAFANGLSDRILEDVE